MLFDDGWGDGTEEFTERREYSNPTETKKQRGWDQNYQEFQILHALWVLLIWFEIKGIGKVEHSVIHSIDT